MKVKKAVIPAAGLGTRLLPATKNIPKEMLPVLDKPLIQYAVEESITAGIEDIIIVTARGKETIENHFDRCAELEQHLSAKNDLANLRLVQQTAGLTDVAYVHQKEAKGLGHAVWCARKLVGREPFAVILPDDLIVANPPGLTGLIQGAETYGKSIIMVRKVPRDEVSKYGIITPGKLHNSIYTVKDLVEKPSVPDAPSDLAVLGRYVLVPEVFTILENLSPGYGGEIQLTDAIRQLVKRSGVYAIEYTGRHYDVGRLDGYLRALVELGLEHPGLGPTFKNYLVKLSKSFTS